MRATGAARLLVLQALWRVTGLRAAGRALVEILGSDDEDLRTMAAMSLVQSGGRAIPLLREALRARAHLPMVLTILGDIADPRVKSELIRFSQDPDPRAAEAARDAVRTLDARQHGRAAS